MVTKPARSFHVIGPLSCSSYRWYLLQINGFKCLLGAMQQDSQIIPVHTKVLTYRVLVTFFQEDFAQQPPIPLWQLVENLTDPLLHFFVRQDRHNIQRLIGNIHGFFVIVQILARSRAIVLQQYIVANGIHKSPQPFRLFDSALATQSGEDPDKSLLPQVGDDLWRMHPGTQLELDQLAEINDKMTFCAEVA